MENIYYDGGPLLSQRDLRGEKPEIYMCTTNRTGGKTTFFNRLEVNRFIKQGKKFALIYRFADQLKNVHTKFFKDINTLFFEGYEMSSTLYKDNGYAELILNGKPCGYALALNVADKIKTVSHIFSDVESMLFDEFQSETNHYCPDEITKFMSVHTSVARGQGKQVRYVPVYMIANPVTMLNPYYNSMGVSSRLKKETRFLKGNGWVLEQGYVESAAKAQKESGFNIAFQREKYAAYASEGLYLNDSASFIEKPTGKSRYCFTLKYENKHFGVYEFLEHGYVYCSPRYNDNYPTKLTLTTQDHDINYLMLQKNELLINQMRYLFTHGSFRFADLECKEVILKMLSYY